MKNKIVSLLAIVFGIMTISFPLIGIVSGGATIGLSVLFVSIYALLIGISIIDYNTYGSILDIIMGMILLLISVGLIFNTTLIGFLSEISLYLGGIILIIAGVVSLLNNRTSKTEFYIGIAGIILGVCYIIIGTYIADPFILGALIGIWLLINGGLRLMK